jgi:hypothetical protein
MKSLVKTGHKGFPNALRGCVLAVLLLVVADASQAQTSDTTAKPMVLPWIADVVKMSAAGVPQDVIQVYVKNSSARSTLSPDDIIYLRGNGVATGIINTMIEHGASQPAAVAAAAPMAQPQYAPQAPAYAPAPQAPYYEQPASYSDEPSSSVYYIASSASNPYYGNPYYYNTYPYWYYYPTVFYSTGFRNCFPGSRNCFPRVGFTAGFHGNNTTAVRFAGGGMGGRSVGAARVGGGGRR